MAINICSKNRLGFPIVALIFCNLYFKNTTNNTEHRPLNWTTNSWRASLLKFLYHIFSFQSPISIQEFGPISHIDICEESPHYIAVSASTRVSFYWASGAGLPDFSWCNIPNRKKYTKIILKFTQMATKYTKLGKYTKIILKYTQMATKYTKLVKFTKRTLKYTEWPQNIPKWP
jgi:hypothetical protein